MAIGEIPKRSLPIPTTRSMGTVTKLDEQQGTFSGVTVGGTPVAGSQVNTQDAYKLTDQGIRTTVKPNDPPKSGREAEKTYDVQMNEEWYNFLVSIAEDLDPAFSDIIRLNGTQIVLNKTYGGPSDENMTIDATNGIRFRQGATVLGQMSSSAWRLGNAATENLYLTSTAIQLRDASTPWLDVSAGAIIIGNAAAGTEYIWVNSTGIAMYGGGVQHVSLSSAGAFWAGDSITSERIQWDSTNGLVIYDKDNNARITMSTTAAGAVDGSVTIGGLLASTINGWKHASDTTKIDGGDIYAGSITLTSAASDFDLASITGDLDDVSDGSTSGKVNLTRITGGNIVLVGNDTDGEYMGVEATNGIRMYGNNVLNIQLTNAGLLYLGDQSNEHVKVSSSGTQIYDGATLLATYAASTTFYDTGGADRLALGTSGISVGDPTDGEYITVDVTNGIRLYGNATVTAQLTNAGLLYLGDQSNEHVKVSTSGTQVYDGAVLYATYGATTTIGLVASEHVEITATSVKLKDGATSHVDLTAGTIIVGEVGASLSNIEITSGAINFRVNAVTKWNLATSGASSFDLIVGSDVTLAPSDSDPALIKWSTVHNFGAATTAARGLCIWPTTIDQDYFAVGYDPVNAAYQYYKQIILAAQNSVQIRSYVDANNYVYAQALGSLDQFKLDVKGAGTLGQYEFKHSSLEPNPDSQITLGAAGLCWLDVFADAGVTACSMGKFKKKITPETLGLEFINAINPIIFEWDGIKSNHDRKNKKFRGVLADEMQAVLDQVGYTDDFAGIVEAEVDGELWMGFKYEQMISPIIKGIQELTEVVGEVIQRVELLEAV